jgi:hypothetical protein
MNKRTFARFQVYDVLARRFLTSDLQNRLALLRAANVES